MDERLAKALDFSNYMVTLNNQKRIIREKYNENLLYFFDGCQFTITRELITFVNIMTTAASPDSVVITDDNGIPAKITNISEFYNNIIEVYTSASDNYHAHYELLKSNRRVERLVNHDI